jgi:WD40 repeat protein
VRLWDVATGKPIRQLMQRGQEVLDVAFSPDGKTVVAGNLDGHVYLLDTASGKQLGDITVSSADPGSVFGVGFSPDGKSILAGGIDRIVRIFDLATGKQTQQFVGHSDSVTRVAFSPDGKTILTGSIDSTARLWDAATGKELRRFASSMPVLAVAFSPDGKMLLTGGKDKTARLWDVDYHDTIAYLCSHLLRDLTDAERAEYDLTNTGLTCPTTS